MFDFLMNLLFGPKTVRIGCCYCNHVISAPVAAAKVYCSNPLCGRELPHLYREVKHAWPMFVPMLGWTSAGKSTWIMSTVMRMGDYAALVGHGAAFLPANDDTIRLKRQAELYRSEGRAPDSTSITEETITETYLLSMLRLPRWGDRTIVLRDVPGEYFEPRLDREKKKEVQTVPDKYLPYLQVSTTCMFMLSLSDLFKRNDNDGRNESSSPHGKTMDGLLVTLLNGLPADTKGRRVLRKVIVVITKSDALNSGPAQLPPHLYNYLVSDPACYTSVESIRETYSDIDNYLSELAVVSNEIQEWINTLQGGTQLIALAEAMNLKLRFAIISGLGCETRPPTERPTGGMEEGPQLEGQWKPYRVLDPVFWALELESERVPRMAQPMTTGGGK